MEIPRCQKAALEQVDRFWSLLDDMSQNDPGAYETFLKRQLRDGAQYFSPPQPRTCLRTSTQKKRYCTSTCAGGDVCLHPPLPLSLFQYVADAWSPFLERKVHLLLHLAKKSGTIPGQKYSLVDVAFNPEVLQMAEASVQEKDQIHLLALHFIQQQNKLNLSPHFTVTKAKLKGSLQDMKRRLMSSHQSKCSTANMQTKPAPSLLQQICSLRTEESAEGCVTRLSGGQGQGPARAGLVTVMSSTEAARCPQPRHQLTVCPETSTRTLRLRVDLPGVHAVSQCQLSITQVDVLLEVEDMYYLHLWFPEAVDENTCCATYNKKKHTLTVTVCVL